jgi:hypothetical protein
MMAQQMALELQPPVCTLQVCVNTHFAPATPIAIATNDLQGYG